MLLVVLSACFMQKIASIVHRYKIGVNELVHIIRVQVILKGNITPHCHFIIPVL